MIILVSNDDGISSEGITILEESLRHLGDIWMVAPERAQNAVGRALTLHRPLRITQLADRRYVINGTPSDCVNLAINKILPEPPNLVVSGINRGANLCDDISYSGTVAAAFEATILGVCALSVSLQGRHTFMFGPAGRFTAYVSEKILQHGLPRDTFLNINVPDTRGKEITSWEITHQGKSIYANIILEKNDPRGQKYYWIGGDGTQHQDIPGSDADALARQCASITPITTDLTRYDAMDFLKKLKI